MQLLQGDASILSNQHRSHHLCSIVSLRRELAGSSIPYDFDRFSCGSAPTKYLLIVFEQGFSLVACTFTSPNTRKEGPDNCVLCTSAACALHYPAKNLGVLPFYLCGSDFVVTEPGFARTQHGQIAVHFVNGVVVWCAPGMGIYFVCT